MLAAKRPLIIDSERQNNDSFQRTCPCMHRHMRYLTLVRLEAQLLRVKEGGGIPPRFQVPIQSERPSEDGRFGFRVVRCGDRTCRARMGEIERGFHRETGRRFLNSNGWKGV